MGSGAKPSIKKPVFRVLPTQPRLPQKSPKALKAAGKAFAAITVITLAACTQDTKPHTTSDMSQPRVNWRQAIEKIKSNDLTKSGMVAGIDALLAGDAATASRKFNLSLGEDPANPWLHYLNGLAYHLQAEQGDPAKYDLAEAGYQQALKFDPSNALAALQLGRVKMARREFAAAQDQFANALLLQPGNVDALYEMARASYQRGDLKNARVMIDQALVKAPGRAEVQRAAALIAAAFGEGEKASAHFQKYAELIQDDFKSRGLENRLNDWKSLHERGKIVIAQVTAPEDVAAADPEPGQTDGQNGTSGDQAQPEAAAAPDGASPGTGEVVVVDAIVMRVSETGTTQKGNNILNNLTVTLAPGTHYYARGHGRGRKIVDSPIETTLPDGTIQRSYPTIPTSAADISSGAVFPAQVNGAGSQIPFDNSSITAGGNRLSVSHLFTQGVSFGSFTYSLKIANARREYVEVLGRPSLVASVGKAAKFFSGNELALGLSGTVGGGTVTKTPVGVTLAVTPTALEGDSVTLDVEIYGSLVDASELAKDATKTFVNFGLSKVRTSVKMKLGETMMLGGIFEKIDTNNNEGFPILKDIPFIQYFFSQENTSESRKSVMYLITPRKYDTNKQSVVDFMKGGEKFANIAELQEKYRDWYAPYNNTAIILNKLGSIYREYRTGDMTEVAWGMQDNIESLIEQALSFVYY
ncbi:MAG: tetratricopeptide repeat protein [Holosporales bacterium]